MAPALTESSGVDMGFVQSALIDATDDVAAASDLLKLLCLAGAGMGQDQGAAIARGAMIAHDYLEAVRARIQEARYEIQRLNHTSGSSREEAKL